MPPETPDTQAPDTQAPDWPGPDSTPTPAPGEVIAGYSSRRPPRTWGYRLMATALVLIGIGSIAGFTKITFEDLPRSWEEDVPVVTLTAEEIAAAHAVPSYDSAVPVLAYHFVTSRTDNDLSGPYTTTPAEFATHMAALDEAGFTTITAEELQGFVQDGDPLPDKPILLTFDDGHATNRHVVDPILARHDFNAVGFLITGRVSEDTSQTGFHLTRQDVQALEATGRWQFGSHTHGLHHKAEGLYDEQVTALDHRIHTEAGDLETEQEYAARIAADLDASVAWMQANLADPLWQFSYPLGGRGAGEAATTMEAELHAALAEHGFDLAYTVGEFVTEHSVTPTNARLIQPRIDMPRGTSATQMLESIVQSLPVDVGGEQPLDWNAALTTARD